MEEYYIMLALFENNIDYVFKHDIQPNLCRQNRYIIFLFEKKEIPYIYKDLRGAGFKLRVKV